MKKTLIISPCNLPIPATLGGAVETLIDNLSDENEKVNNNEFTIISIYNDESFNLRDKYKNTKYVYIKKGKLLESFDNIINKTISFLIKSRRKTETNMLWKFKVLNFIKKYLKNNDFDAVVLENQGYYTKVYKSSKIRCKYKDKLFFHLHNVIPNNINIDFIKNERMLVISNYLKNDIIKKFPFVNEKNIVRLKNGINCDKFKRIPSDGKISKLRNKYGFKENDFVVSFVGRIVPEKGILEVLNAVQKINNKNIKLLIVGSIEFGKKKSSSFELKIKKLCQCLGDRCVMTGFVPNDELYMYYKSSQLAVLPSMWEEPAGLTMIEALASGTPLITTNSGGIPEYIEADMATILDKNNNVEQALKDKVMDAFCNYDKYKKQAGNACKKISMLYNTTKFYDDFSDCIKK